MHALRHGTVKWWPTLRPSPAHACGSQPGGCWAEGSARRDRKGPHYVTCMRAGILTLHVLLACMHAQLHMYIQLRTCRRSSDHMPVCHHHHHQCHHALGLSNNPAWMLRGLVSLNLLTALPPTSTAHRGLHTTCLYVIHRTTAEDNALLMTTITISNKS